MFIHFIFCNVNTSKGRKNYSNDRVQHLAIKSLDKLQKNKPYFIESSDEKPRYERSRTAVKYIHIRTRNDATFQRGPVGVLHTQRRGNSARTYRSYVRTCSKTARFRNARNFLCAPRVRRKKTRHCERASHWGTRGNTPRRIHSVSLVRLARS